MDVREKLVELLQNAKAAMKSENLSCDIARNMFVVDFMIANGVTVQDGKPLDAFLHPVDAYKGLKAKYLVFKADTGERVGNCFVLRPDKDPAAVEAIRAYARATDNETLAEDIYNWVGKGEPVQEWISVDDRQPNNKGCYLLTVKHWFDGEPVVREAYWNGKDWFSCDDRRYKITPRVTHWMQLPNPPKGE